MQLIVECSLILVFRGLWFIDPDDGPDDEDDGPDDEDDGPDDEDDGPDDEDYGPDYEDDGPDDEDDGPDDEDDGNSGDYGPDDDPEEFNAGVDGVLFGNAQIFQIQVLLTKSEPRIVWSTELLYLFWS